MSGETYNLNEITTGSFLSDGTLALTFSPPSTEWWSITSMAVLTDDPVTSTVIPQARVTLDGIFKEGTYSGNLDASDCLYRVEKGQQFTCTWTGGTAGNTGTFTVNGERTTY